MDLEVGGDSEGRKMKMEIGDAGASFVLRPGATASVHMFFTIIQTEKTTGELAISSG